MIKELNIWKYLCNYQILSLIFSLKVVFSVFAIYIQLKTNPYNIDVIGFTGNDPDFINNLIAEFADREEGFESTLLNKLKSIYEDLGWDFPSLNEKVNKFFKFV